MSTPWKFVTVAASVTSYPPSACASVVSVTWLNDAAAALTFSPGMVNEAATTLAGAIS